MKPQPLKIREVTNKEGFTLPYMAVYCLVPDVYAMMEWLKQKCDTYRKSNELWRKSQDENLSDFEDWIDEAMGK